ncbi:keratin, type I cytoskeletal 18-like isoform X2 [Scomber scombrus]|uniref:keratin, type I cytoskeletal 18-like isoform X2 n=1 Tax=Scomber scombrus TaxID=13677 RepID=UPI002DD98297|nr:keratin, type I cytoskeletal 18-like isoform X2 [Scomber scombrus]
MDLLQDSSHTMLGLNARLKGFLEQVNRLQEANRRLEAQIAEWGIRSTSRSQDWSQQERTVKDLRAQVGKLLMENAQLALQSDSMKSRAAAIQARCDTEEQNTWRLEQQVAMLRETKRKAEQNSVTLQTNLRRSMTELQEINQEFQWSITESTFSPASALRGPSSPPHIHTHTHTHTHTKIHTFLLPALPPP